MFIKLEKKMKTSKSTPILFSNRLGDQIEFEEKSFVPKTTLKAKKVVLKENLTKKELYELLKSLQAQFESKKVKKEPETSKKKPKRLSYKKKITQKRVLVEKMLNNTSLSIKQISTVCSCSKKLIANVIQLKQRDVPLHFEYPNQKKIEEVKSLEDSIDEKVFKQYITVNQLKISHPTFSRTFIRKTLLRKGLSWTRLPQLKERYPKKNRTYSEDQIKEIASHLLQASSKDPIKILYVDEMYFPLFQTPTHCWDLGRTKTERRYNVRKKSPEKTLSMLAACSQTGFEAVQFLDGSTNSFDFVFFIEGVLSRFKEEETVTVILDNASWHKSKIVKQSLCWKYLHFIPPKLYESNLIENAFSSVRFGFRMRQETTTIEQEAQIIADIVFSEKIEQNFKGFYEHHLRQLEGLMEKYLNFVLK